MKEPNYTWLLVLSWAYAFYSYETHKRDMYSVFTINVPLAVRFATVAIGMRKAESPEFEIFCSDSH